MRIKRALQGTALTAFAALAWFGAGSVGAKASVSIKDVTFDETNVKLEISFSDPELMVGIAKVDKSKKAKVTVWDIYEPEAGSQAGKAEIDLSKLSVVKDNYIAITTNDMDKPLYIKLAATAKRNKITFHGNTAKISDFKADGKDVEEIEYRRTTDAWTNVSYKIADLNFSEYQYQGAVLYIRQSGVDELAKITNKDAIDAYKGIQTEEVDINTVKNAAAINVPVYVIGKLPGKEVKLNIAKQANGPSVPVDYKKGTVTINKNLEYRVIKTAGVATYEAISSKSVKEINDLLKASDSVSAASSGVIEVRKQAVTRGKGKSASKWTRVKIEEPKTLSFSQDTQDINTATVDKPVTISTTSGAIMEAGYKLNSKGTAVTHLVLTNKTSDNYEYYLGSSAPAAGDKDIKTIKNNKAVNIKQEDASGKNVYIRLAGDKRAKRWAGAWTQAGTGIKIPVIASK
ncbi:MAG: hypothetical protein K1W24_01235 [Lachnospiraceae bacterium]